MSGKINRRAGGGSLLPAMLVVFLAVAAAGGIYAWQRLRAQLPAAPQAAPPSTARLPRRDEPLTMNLYYPAAGALIVGTAPVKRQPDTQAQARETLAALFADPRVQQADALRDVKLRAFFLDASGAAYVDLSPVTQNGVKASARGELLAIYSVIDTLTQNFEEIKQVRFLIEGKEAQTLAGHIDLAGKFEKRMDLVKQ